MRTRSLFVLALLSITVLASEAGQIPSHIYTSLQSRSGLTGAAKKAVDENLSYYLTGAQGPDTIGIIQYELQKISFFNSVGEETHYSPQKDQLAFNILAKATNDKERAYALGWMTHYVNDANVHPVVNNYGGFYEKHKTHHKELEQLENKHVFAKHGDVVNKDLATTIPAVFGKDFALFIFDAYGATYPNEKKYQTGNDWGLFPNREYFADQEDKAAAWCLAAEQTFWKSHSDGTGKHGYWPSTAPMPDMPSSQAYAHAMKAIEVSDVVASADRLLITVKVNDSKLYGRFTADWEKATAQAITQGKTLLGAASAYVEKPDDTTKAALVRLIPTANLDQPLANFDDTKVFPGDITVDRVKYKLTIKPQPVSGKPAQQPKVFEGTSAPVVYGSADFAGSSAGTATVDVPLGTGLAPYDFDLTVGLSGTKVETRPEYRDVDWTQAIGKYPGAWMNSAGTVGLGAPFTVTVGIPPSMRGKGGVRRWAVIDNGYELTTSDLNALDMNTWSKEVRPDVAVLEENVSGNSITATLQVTDMRASGQQQLAGAQLVMIWAEHGKPGDLRGMDAIGQIEEEYSAALNRLASNPNLAKLEDAVAKYIAELNSKGISLEEQKKLAEKKATELIPKFGLTEAYADVDKARAELEASDSVPFHVKTDINLKPTALSFPIAAGWTEKVSSPPPAFHDKQRVEKYASEKHANGKAKWTVSAGLELAWDRYGPEEEARLKASHSSAEERTLTIGDFSGPLYIETKDVSPHERTVYAWGLLHKGEAGMSVFYYLQGWGAEITDQGTKIYDGAEDMQRNMKLIQGEIDGMYPSATSTMVQ